MFAIEYIAGLVDGEGHIGCYSSGDRKYKKFYPRIGITNTCLEVLQEIQKQLGGSIKPKTYGLKGKPSNWKNGYDWRLSGDQARKLIEILIPHLFIKKTKAIETLLADCKTRKYKGE